VIRTLLESKDIAELLREHIPKIVEEYFHIMEEVSSDEVLSALQVNEQFQAFCRYVFDLQVIVTEFGGEIQGMAPEMVFRLLNIFHQFNAEGEEDDEAEFMATQCLDTITAVMSVSCCY